MSHDRTPGPASGAQVQRDPHRNFPLQDLARALQDQSARSVDVIAGSGAIRSIGGPADGNVPAEALQSQPATRTKTRTAGRRGAR